MLFKNQMIISKNRKFLSSLTVIRNERSTGSESASLNKVFGRTPIGRLLGIKIKIKDHTTKTMNVSEKTLLHT